MKTVSSFLIDDWATLLPAPWLPICLVLTAVVCGVMIGAEREKREKPAGLRTLVLVCLGATVFTLMSFRFAGPGGDAGRLAAQIVTGVGFLGAGVIMRASGGITGTTTAATIWVTASIGMTVGAGYAGAGLGLSLLLRFLLTALLAWQHHVIGGLRAAVVELIAEPDRGKTRIHIEKILEDYHIPEMDVKFTDLPDGAVRARVSIRLPQRHRREFLEMLAALPAVREIREERGDEGGTIQTNH